MTQSKEIQYISFLQFVGPIFVILGHSLNGITSNGAWWVFSKEWIYIFHMPLFFLIAGYLLSYTGWIKEKTYGAFVKKKFLRLIVPYLFWNAICFLPKLFLQEFISDSVELNVSYIMKIFLAPRQNIWGHTWFLVGLFLVYLAAPAWQKLFSKGKNKNIISFFVIGIILYILPIKTEFLCLSDLHKDILFFGLGCYLGTIRQETLILWGKKCFTAFLILSIASSSITIWIYSEAWFKFIPCTFILLFLLSCGIILDGKLSRISILAKNSFSIYIMHWPVMLLCRVVFLQILKFDVICTVIIMIVAGYLIPNIAVGILRKIKLGKTYAGFKYLIGV